MGVNEERKSVTRYEFCEDLSLAINSGDVGEGELFSADHQGDGLIRVRMVDGSFFNVNVTGPHAYPD